MVRIVYILGAGSNAAILVVLGAGLLAMDVEDSHFQCPEGSRIDIPQFIHSYFWVFPSKSGLNPRQTQGPPPFAEVVPHTLAPKSGLAAISRPSGTRSSSPAAAKPNGGELRSLYSTTASPANSPQRASRNIEAALRPEKITKLDVVEAPLAQSSKVGGAPHR